jgi:orotidine-5'-phosphate decarboxylase
MNRIELTSRIRERQSFLCVGLDPELEKIPAHLLGLEHPVLTFIRAIIDATRAYCVAYKPNLAFFESLGPEGWQVFEETVRYIGPDHLIIADAKRGDIGNTSRMYAEAFFNRYGCDALTVAPYMGRDSVAPFLEFEDKWTIVLGLTSNSGSSDFQQSRQSEGGERLFEKVIREAAGWGNPDKMMFVIGATHADEFALVRRLVPDHFLLVPGVGAQGGDLELICQHGLNAEVGLLVNAARSIIYASSGRDYAEAAGTAAQALQRQMANLLRR